jgi:hypothetical protein
MLGRPAPMFADENYASSLELLKAGRVEPLWFRSPIVFPEKMLPKFTHSCPWRTTDLGTMHGTPRKTFKLTDY